MAQRFDRNAFFKTGNGNLLRPSVRLKKGAKAANNLFRQAEKLLSRPQQTATVQGTPSPIKMAKGLLQAAKRVGHTGAPRPQPTPISAAMAARAAGIPTA